MDEREASKRDWNCDDSSAVMQSEIDGGSLQRIADAVEAMAQYHVHLIRDLEEYKGKYRVEQARCVRLLRSNAGLRGVITKMKGEREK